MAKISVIIPARNEEATIARVLDDLNKTIPELASAEVEVICVDDH
jgi:glycosyltransferase involved in cell wall biosynthesis